MTDELQGSFHVVENVQDTGVQSVLRNGYSETIGRFT